MRSPFKFLDAYTREDKDTFFGRDEEVATLLEMVKKNRLALIYGPSGAGKTSLVQCGLSSRFHATDWYPLYIRRNEDINRSLDEALAEGLKEGQYEDAVQAVDELYVEYLRPVYLIFDQLEELLILGGEEEQRRFVDSIARIQEAQLPCRILFLLREEYLAHLYHFEKAIPRLFTRRLRVEPMGRANVREVVTRSCAAFNISFEDEEHNPEQVIDNVSHGRAGVSLPYLQVYLDRLYQADFQRTYQRDRQGGELPPLTFTTAEIEAFGAIENVLEQFLTEQEGLIQRELKQRHPEINDALVRQVLDTFVSERGTKRPIPFRIKGKLIEMDPEAYPFLASLPAEVRTDCLKALQRSRILNDEGNVYELAHDSLAALIDEARTDEERQRNEVKRRIGNAYAEYQATGVFLNRKQLASIEDFLEELEPAFRPEVQAFIRESYEQAERKEQAELQEERRKRRRAWRIAAGFGVLTVLAVIASIVAFLFSKEAQRESRRAADKAFEAAYLNASLFKKEGAYARALESINDFDIPITRESANDSLAELKQTIERLQFHFNTSDSLRQEGKLREALAELRKAAALSPDTFLLQLARETETELETAFEEYRRLGNSLSNNSMHRQALQAYSKALELKPNDPYLHYNLACIYSLLRDAELSFHHLERAVELGYRETARIRTDAALAFLRAQPGFGVFAQNGYRRPTEDGR